MCMRHGRVLQLIHTNSPQNIEKTKHLWYNMVHPIIERRSLMKKILAFILLFSCLCLLVGCKTETKSEIFPTDVENVTLRIENVSPIGATLIIKDTNETSDLYGEWYKIEKNIDGTWYDVATVIDNYGFSYIGYLTNDNNEVSFEINWEWLYGSLPTGTYRILKQAYSQYISIEFEIQ